jgi:hypothetical protein
MSIFEIRRIGFAQPTRRERARTRWNSALTHLITIGALVIAIAVAGTAVTVGMARADALAAISADPAAGLALVVLLGFVLVGMVIVTAATLSDSARSVRR